MAGLARRGQLTYKDAALSVLWAQEVTKGHGAAQSSSKSMHATMTLIDDDDVRDVNIPEGM